MTNNRPIKASVAMGLLCALVGVATAVWLLAISTGSGYEWFLIAAPAAAFLTGAFLWWLLLARNGRYGTARGVVAGAVAGAVAHWTCWMFMALGAFACHAFTGGCAGSLGDAPIGPIDALWASAIYSLYSLFFVGWLTVPAGALVGGLLARAQARPNPATAS